jgi:SAM-dependent methyltransferase
LSTPAGKSFPDHFSALAAEYARYRPGYSDQLIDWVADQAPRRHTVWDCGCGSGQATVALARRFDRVIATDASREQVRRVPESPAVRRVAATAEDSGLRPDSCDAVVVAQALHWFDLPRFWQEVGRTARPGALFAAWSYGMPTFADHGMNALVAQLHNDVLGAYWPIERGQVLNRYRDIVTPFMPVAVPSFAMHATWSLEAFAGYLRSWSAVRRYVDAHGFDPVAPVAAALHADWGDRALAIEWPLAVVAGRVR